jgi:hypothetical protein
MNTLQGFFYNDDLYYLVNTSEQLWSLLGMQTLLVDELQIIWTEDKRVEIYAVWHVGHIERLSPNTPVFFKSTYPVSRFLCVVESMEDVELFDPKVPAIVNHVVDFAHIPGLKPYSHEIKLAYLLVSYDYSWWDYYFGWVYTYFYP